MSHAESPLSALQVTVLAGCATAWLEGHEFHDRDSDRLMSCDDRGEAVSHPVCGDDRLQRSVALWARWRP